MEPHADWYALIGVPAGASPQEIQNAYRESARRFHPDSNSDPGAADEIKRINQAYEVLRDPDRRAQHDRQRAAGAFTRFDLRLTPSRTTLLELDEPQVVYALLNIAARRDAPAPARAPLNLCVVVDRSTSMSGKRLDHVKSGLSRMLEELQPRDVFAVVSFSDRAEVVLPAAADVNRARAVSRVSAIHAGGGTEILQGLIYGMTEVHREFSPQRVNHVLLITDGQTYGDEDDCLLLAKMAAGEGIGISAVGIGDEWNDVFVDRLAAVTGGNSDYVEAPQLLGEVLAARMNAIASVFAERVRVQVAPDVGVQIRNATRLTPEPQPLDASARPFMLGGMSPSDAAAVLLEFELPPLQSGDHKLARLSVLAEIIAPEAAEVMTALDITLPALRGADAERPPESIASALGRLILYQLQEKAWRMAASGDVDAATRMLIKLADHLHASGESELAHAALEESDRLGRTHSLSSEGHKRLKYGTRALICAPSDTS